MRHDSKGDLDMTIQERQMAAVAMAVRKALYTLGLDKIRGGEFFGMKQRANATEEEREAA